ncbi:MAG: Crp/Fnr family transcriptional regulator [Clostridia bacterium]|nr:Crp/Fnr family transcriptional regulator [Clostridia bacterium]
MKTEISEAVKKYFSFYEKLTTAQFDYLVKSAYFVNFEKGQIIYSNENECLGVLVLFSGELRTYMTSYNGKEVTLYRTGSSDICIMSASCALKNISFDVTIEALADCAGLLIPITAFEKVMKENVYVENFAQAVALNKFSDVMWAMEQLLFSSFEKRLASFLYDESVKTKTMVIKLTHEQIARYISSAREVVSRMLKNFEKEGIVALSSGAIEVIDKEKLKKIVNE